VKNPRNAVVDRPLSMKERAKKARHEAYVLAKQRKKNDPRTIQLKEKMKQGRREANAQRTPRAGTRRRAVLSEAADAPSIQGADADA
jgi:hypothetical protein